MMKPKGQFTKEVLERAALLCRTNAEAATALDVTKESFESACYYEGVETPNERHRRVAAEADRLQEKLPFTKEE